MAVAFHLSVFSPVIVQPERLTHMESWHRHIPFALAMLDMLKPRVLVELGSHWGDSYCAFCQGVVQQGLSTRCYAVDTWQGDEHAGKYGEEVFEDLSDWHDQRYSKFSTLMRMRFDEALAYFPDGSVDLLHIDGLHTYEAVKHDFESWLPKLSERAVVLFHDTNVRYDDFGVWQLWAELEQQYPSFEFPYGFGLGVLAVGSRVPDAVLEFLAYANEHAREVVDFFHGKGDAAEIRKKVREVERIGKNLNLVGAQLGEVRAIAEERDSFIQELQEAWQRTQDDLQIAQEQSLEARQKVFEQGSELHSLQLHEAALVKELKRTQLKLLQNSELLRQANEQGIAVESQLRMVLTSRFWRLRNMCMRMLGLSHRAVYFKPTGLGAAVSADEWKVQDFPKVTIIVPVYGGEKDTIACIESILASTYCIEAELVVINDASPEPGLVDWLNANAHRFTLLHNEINLGFVGTVNRGMALYLEQDVVLVNSDTEVAGDWLDRLQKAAYSTANTGSVTPFSNNATICSYPRFCQDNELPDGYDVARLDELCARVNAGQLVDIPTAVGFCMYIRRDCLNDAGGFNAELFGRGYGEENEFCMRSAKRGWRHVLTADTFVYHKGGVSFAETQSENQLHGHRVLTGLYPDYDWIIQQHIAQDPAQPLRFAIDAAIARESDKPVVVMINHGRGGGGARHVRELASMIEDQVQVYLLAPEGSGLLCLRPMFDNGQRSALYFMPGRDDVCLLDTLRQLQVSRLHYHHLIDLPAVLVSLAEHLPCSYDVTLHDYYLACPQVTLADAKGDYCGAPDEAGCSDCLAKRPVPGVQDIISWREKHSVFLSGAERVFVPSQDLLRRMEHYFPGVRFTWAQHELPVDVKPVQVDTPAADEPLRVLVLGALSVFKGADKLEAVALAARKDRKQLEFHLLGYAYRPLRTWPSSSLKVHGRYMDEELQQKIQEIRPHVVWFPGECPETWSYTLSAALQAGLPVIAPRLGAFSERLNGRDWTWLIDINQTSGELLDKFLFVRQILIENRPPLVMKAVQEFAPFCYVGSYTSTLGTGAFEERSWVDLGEAWKRLSAESQVQLLPHIKLPWVRSVLLFGLRRGWLQSLAARIPYGVKQKIKSWLNNQV